MSVEARLTIARNHICAQRFASEFNGSRLQLLLFGSQFEPDGHSEFVSEGKITAI